MDWRHQVCGERGSGAASPMRAGCRLHSGLPGGMRPGHIRTALMQVQWSLGLALLLLLPIPLH